MTETTTTAPLTVSADASVLFRHLSAVLPHAGTDETLPVLCGVRVEVSAGCLFFVATDRCSLAASRLRIPGGSQDARPDRAALLPPGNAKALLHYLRNATATVALTFLAASLVAEDSSGATETFRLEPGDGFPAWRPLIAGMIAAEPCELDDGYALSLERTARLTGGRDPLGIFPLSLRLTLGGTGGNALPAPVLLAGRGDWFIASLMPVRLRETPATAWDSWLLPSTAPVASDSKQQEGTDR